MHQTKKPNSMRTEKNKPSERRTSVMSGPNLRASEYSSKLHSLPLFSKIIHLTFWNPGNSIQYKAIGGFYHCYVNDHPSFIYVMTHSWAGCCGFSSGIPHSPRHPATIHYNFLRQQLKIFDNKRQKPVPPPEKIFKKLPHDLSRSSYLPCNIFIRGRSINARVIFSASVVNYDQISRGWRLFIR